MRGNAAIEIPCDCGVTLYVRRVSPDGTWYMQHGPNPEHRTDLYPGGVLFLSATRHWREVVHVRG